MIDEPAATATYCLLSNEYVIGDAFQFWLAGKLHNGLPFAASAATRAPLSSPKITTPPAVLEDAAPRGNGPDLRQFPGDFSCLDVDCTEDSLCGIAGSPAERAAHEAFSRLPLHRDSS